jgi:hypothetical protein
MDDDNAEIAIPETEEWNLLNAAIGLARMRERYRRAGLRLNYSDSKMAVLQEDIALLESVLDQRYKAYMAMKKRRKISK